MSAQIIGFLRFSFFGPSDTKLSYDDRQAAFDALYARERMETRFALFENLFLPSLRAQTDGDFRLIVLSSACMPEHYRARLAACCADIPQIEIVTAEGEDLAAEIRPYTENRRAARGGLLQFRCDDDDAMGARFIERLRYWQPRLRDHMLLTQPRGLMLYETEGQAHLHPMYRNLTGAGFAYFSEGPTKRNVFGFAHLNAGRRVPYISDPATAAFIQTFTPTSDTAFRSARKIRKFLAASGVDAESGRSDRMAREAVEQDFPAFAIDGLKALLLDAIAPLQAAEAPRAVAQGG